MSLLITNPILTAEMLQRVRTAAAADPRGHDPRFATEVATKDGEIVGAIACCSLPITNIWSHSEKNHVRDTIMLINIARSLTHRVSGGRPALTLCAASSPIFPFMERFGFVKLGETVLFEERSVV